MNAKTKPLNRTRMTAYIRDNMLDRAVVTSGISERFRQLVIDRAGFAEDVRQALLKSAKTSDPHIRELGSKVRAIMAGNETLHAFIKSQITAYTVLGFEVNLNGMSLHLWLDGRKWDSENKYRTPEETFLSEDMKAEQDGENARYVPFNKANLASPELADRFMKLEADHAKAVSDEQSLRLTLTAAIKQYGTVETMLDAWPEAADLLPRRA